MHQPGLKHLPASLAAEVEFYIAHASARADRESNLCEGLSRFLQTLLGAESSWDRGAVLDGVLPRQIRTNGAGVEIIGAVFVVKGEEWTMAPVQATLAANGGDGSSSYRILFGDRSSEPTPYDESFKLHRLRIPEHPSDWSYVFEGAG